MKKVVAIIQARVGSTRLPGKVLMDIRGKPMLQRVIERVKRAKLINEVIVAFTVNDRDDKIADLVYKLGLSSYRGKELNVLDRLFRAATWKSADIIVRITSDCPLIDPVLIDKTIEYFLNDDFDYVANTEPGNGFEVEVFSYKTLEKAWEEATNREHIAPYIKKNHSLKVGSLTYPHIAHCSVDTLEDLEFVRMVYRKLGDNFTMEDVLNEINQIL